MTSLKYSRPDHLFSMKRAADFALVLVTAPNLAVARKLVRLALEARVAACGNLVPKLESHYWWQGKIEVSREVLILFKTRQSLLPELEKLILANHPYDTPEVIVLPIAQGAAKYLRWITASVRGDQRKARARPS